MMEITGRNDSRWWLLECCGFAVWILVRMKQKVLEYRWQGPLRGRGAREQMSARLAAVVL